MALKEDLDQWQSVLADPEWATLSKPEQDDLRRQFYQQVIKPQGPQAGAAFIAAERPLTQPEEVTAGGAFGRGFARNLTGTAARALGLMSGEEPLAIREEDVLKEAIGGTIGELADPFSALLGLGTAKAAAPLVTRGVERLIARGVTPESARAAGILGAGAAEGVVEGALQGAIEPDQAEGMRARSALEGALLGGLFGAAFSAPTAFRAARGATLPGTAEPAVAPDVAGAAPLPAMPRPTAPQGTPIPGITAPAGAAVLQPTTGLDLSAIPDDRLITLLVEMRNDPRFRPEDVAIVEQEIVRRQELAAAPAAQAAEEAFMAQQAAMRAGVPQPWGGRAFDVLTGAQEEAQAGVTARRAAEDEALREQAFAAQQEAARRLGLVAEQEAAAAQPIPTPATAARERAAAQQREAAMAAARAPEERELIGQLQTATDKVARLQRTVDEAARAQEFQAGDARKQAAAAGRLRSLQTALDEARAEQADVIERLQRVQQGIPEPTQAPLQPGQPVETPEETAVLAQIEGLVPAGGVATVGQVDRARQGLLDAFKNLVRGFPKEVGGPSGAEFRAAYGRRFLDIARAAEEAGVPKQFVERIVEMAGKRLQDKGLIDQYKGPSPVTRRGAEQPQPTTVEPRVSAAEKEVSRLQALLDADDDGKLAREAGISRPRSGVRDFDAKLAKWKKDIRDKVAAKRDAAQGSIAGTALVPVSGERSKYVNSFEAAARNELLEYAQFVGDVLRDPNRPMDYKQEQWQVFSDYLKELEQQGVTFVSGGKEVPDFLNRLRSLVLGTGVKEKVTGVEAPGARRRTVEEGLESFKAGEAETPATTAGLSDAEKARRGQAGKLTVQQMQGMTATQMANQIARQAIVKPRILDRRRRRKSFKEEAEINARDNQFRQDGKTAIDSSAVGQAALEDLYGVKTALDSQDPERDRKFRPDASYVAKSVGTDPDLSKLSYNEAVQLRDRYNGAIKTREEAVEPGDKRYGVEVGFGVRANDHAENLGQLVEKLVRENKLSVEDGREIFRRVMLMRAGQERYLSGELSGGPGQGPGANIPGAYSAGHKLGLSAAQIDRVLRFSESEKAVRNGADPTTTPFYKFVEDVLAVDVHNDTNTFLLQNKALFDIENVESLFAGKTKQASEREKMELTEDQQKSLEPLELTYHPLFEGLRRRVRNEVSSILDATSRRASAIRRREIFRAKYRLKPQDRGLKVDEAIDKEVEARLKTETQKQLGAIGYQMRKTASTPESIASLLGEDRFGSKTPEELSTLLQKVFNVSPAKAKAASELSFQKTPYTIGGKPVKGYVVPGAAFEQQNKMRYELGLPQMIDLDTPPAESLTPPSDVKRIVEIDEDGNVNVINDLCQGD